VPKITSPAQRRNGTVESVSYVYRALLVLELLAAGPAGPEDIAARLGVHKRTAQRLLDTMLAAGFVRLEHKESRRYDLTSKIIAIAGVWRNRLSLFEISKPYVQKLRDLTTEFSHVALPMDGQVVELLHARSPHHIRAELHPGRPGPMHASAVGKALAAHLPTEFEAACRIGFERYTRNTLVSRAALADQLRKVRRQGYAVDDEEIELGQRCVAAPIWDDTCQVVAALGIAGPAQRIDEVTIPTLAGHVVALAQELSQALGYKLAVEDRARF
jgi:DNA-binding IclR family transcriptional regulator